MVLAALEALVLVKRKRHSFEIDVENVQCAMMDYLAMQSDDSCNNMLVVVITLLFVPAGRGLALLYCTKSRSNL